MRITKEIAAAVALQLVQTRKDELKVLKTKQSELITEFYIQKLPNDLLRYFEKFPQYTKQTNSTRIKGVGVADSYKYYNFTMSLPQQNNTDRFEVTPEQSKSLIKLDDKITDKEKEISALKNGIELALYNLRTYNNIEKEFPEAFKLLPPSKVNTELAVNIKDIRCKLDKTNC